MAPRWEAPVKKPQKPPMTARRRRAKLRLAGDPALTLSKNDIVAHKFVTDDPCWGPPAAVDYYRRQASRTLAGEEVKNEPDQLRVCAQRTRSAHPAWASFKSTPTIDARIRNRAHRAADKEAGEDARKRCGDRLESRLGARVETEAEARLKVLSRSGTGLDTSTVAVTSVPSVHVSKTRGGAFSRNRWDARFFVTKTLISLPAGAHAAIEAYEVLALDAQKLAPVEYGTGSGADETWFVTATDRVHHWNPRARERIETQALFVVRSGNQWGVNYSRNAALETAKRPPRG